MNAWARLKKRRLLDQFRLDIEIEGYDVRARALFELACREIFDRDQRVCNYRLILDIIDGQWSRTPINPEVPGAKPSRSVIFPEPNRRSHLDTNGLRRLGDFFTMRPFEWPSVPLDAFYRVELLGFCDAGEPLLLDSVREGEPPLRVRLPASPYTGRWTHASWGRADPPAHRVRQEARRRNQKELAHNLFAMGSSPHDKGNRSDD